MSPEETRIRSVYLFLACARDLEAFAGRLAATVPTPAPLDRCALEPSLRKELGLLFRYWATRQIWERLEASESDATLLNLALLRLFTDGFKLPQDGSGIRYAELSTLAEDVHELSHRLTHALGMEYPPLLETLEGEILLRHEAVMKHTADALSLPLDQLASSVKGWAERAPGR